MRFLRRFLHVDSDLCPYTTNKSYFVQVAVFYGSSSFNNGSFNNGSKLFKRAREQVVTNSVNVLAMVRDEHRFVFLYDDQSVDTVLTTLSQYAVDPELTFTWHDAALMAQRVKRLMEDQNAATQLESFPHV